MKKVASLLLLALLGLTMSSKGAKASATSGTGAGRKRGRPSTAGVKHGGGRPSKAANARATRCVAQDTDCHMKVTCDECSVCDIHAFEFGSCAECQEATKVARYDDGGASPAETRLDGAHVAASLAEALTPPAMYFTPSDDKAQGHRPLIDPQASAADLRKAFGCPSWSKLPDPLKFVATLPSTPEGDESASDGDEGDKEDKLGRSHNIKHNPPFNRTPCQCQTNPFLFPPQPTEPTSLEWSASYAQPRPPCARSLRRGVVTSCTAATSKGSSTRAPCSSTRALSFQPRSSSHSGSATRLLHNQHQPKTLVWH